MSTNIVNFNNNKNDIYNQRCINQDINNPFNLHIKTKENDDKCYVDIQTSQSMGPGNYMIDGNYQCCENNDELLKKQVENPYIFIKNGFGVPCPTVIDDESRIGKTQENPRCPQQLCTRPFVTVPYMGRGFGNINVETKLQPGEDSISTRPCNVLSGVNIPHFFTPLVPHLKDNIQNPQHLVEEVAQDGWTRGGAPSRLITRDVDYLERCGYDYMNKEINGEFWQ